MARGRKEEGDLDRDIEDDLMILLPAAVVAVVVWDSVDED